MSPVASASVWTQLARAALGLRSAVLRHGRLLTPSHSVNAAGTSTYTTSTMRVSANLSFLFGECGGGGVAERCKGASEAGFRAVEWGFPYSLPPEQAAATVADAGLTTVLINSDPGSTEAGEMGFAGLPGQEERFKESFERSITYAKALGCPKLHIMSGRCSGVAAGSGAVAAGGREAVAATLEKNLTYAAGRLSHEGIVGLIEPINTMSLPGYVLADYDTAVSVIERVGSPHLRLQLDLFHLQMITGNVTNNINRLVPVTGHVQVAQAPHRHEPSCPGELNFVFIFQKLREAGYDGFVGAEYKPSTPRTSDSLRWMEESGLTF